MLANLGKIERFYLIFLICLIIDFFFNTAFAVSSAKTSAFELRLADTDAPESLVPIIKIVLVLTVLSVAPAILLMMTSFTRMLIVLSFARQAIGSQSMPPNQVLVGLALFLTFFTMSPVLTEIKLKAYDPYAADQISQEQALEALIHPMRNFMMGQTREEDLSLFYRLSKIEQPKSRDEVSMVALMPAFLISELKTAFQMGFLIYVPFLVIDMVVSSILMAMGMMMLPPTVVSLPFKLVLFVLVDGWGLLISSLVKSFHNVAS